MTAAPMTVDDPPQRVGTFQSLRVRNFRLFFGGQLISQIGNWLTLIAQTLLVLKLTDSGVALGLLAACQFGPVLLLGAWAGLVADRSDKRKLLIIVQTIAMVQSFALAVLAFMDHPPVVAIYVVAVLGGITTAFDNPARRAFVVEMVPEDNVQNAVSLNSALMTGSRVVGPALAGLLIATVGFGWSFAVDGDLLPRRDRRPVPDAHQREPRRTSSTPRGKGQVREGLRYVRTMPELWVPLVMMAIVGTFAFNFQTVIPLFVKRTLHGNDTHLHPHLLGRQRRLAGRRAAVGPAHVRSPFATSSGRASASVSSMMLLAVTPNIPLAYPDRDPRRHLEHRLHDGVHRHRAAAVRPVDARSGAGPAGDGVPRQHADRRADPRLHVSAVRRSQRCVHRRALGDCSGCLRHACSQGEGRCRHLTRRRSHVGRPLVAGAIWSRSRPSVSRGGPTDRRRRAAAHP